MKQRDNGPPIVYRTRQDATQEGEVTALARAYQFVLDCRQQKKGSARPTVKSTSEE